MGAIDEAVRVGPGIGPLAVSADPEFLLRGSAEPHPNRLFVDLSLRDRPGIIDGLTQLFVEGIPCCDECATPVVFNIESSLWASLTDVGTAGFVVEPRLDQADAGTHGCRLAALAQRLEDAIRVLLLEGLAVRPEDIYSGPNVQNIGEGPDVALFAGRALGEVRFGVCASYASAAPRFAAVLTEFSRFLGDRDIAIAYICSPTRWEDHRPPDWNGHAGSAPDDEDRYSLATWLRVGFALDSNLETRAKVIDLAYELASRYRLGFAFHDSEFSQAVGPQRPLLMAHQFVHVVAPPCDPDEQVEGASENEYEGVLAVGLARPGLVADLLCASAEAVPELKMLGCSMSVLCGYTVVHLVVAAGQGNSVEDAANTVFASPTHPARRFPTSGPRRIHTTGRDEEDLFWISWVAPEQIGVLNRVTRSVRQVVQSAVARVGGNLVESPERGVPENYVYEISRVIEGGTVCAGKLKVVLPKDIATALWGPGKVEDSEFGRTLEANVCQALGVANAESGWVTSVTRSQWRDRPVVVSYGEPGTEPWAALSILAGSSL